MLKLAIIGAGRHSRLHHGPACRRFKDRIDLAAVCDMNIGAARKFAEDFGFGASYSDYKEMISREKPDAVIAVTPEAATFKIVSDILPFKIPVLMEKPIGNSLFEAQELTALARINSSKIMVSFNRRFSPLISAATGWLRKDAKDSPPQIFRASILRHERHDANFLSATAIHPLDILVSVMGMPEKIDIIKSFSKAGGEPVTKVDMQFENGSLGELIIASDCGTLRENYEIIGNKYCISLEYFSGLKIMREGKLELEVNLDQSSPTEEKEGAIAEMGHFLDCIEGKAPFSPGIQDGLNMAILGEKIQNAKFVL